MAHKFHLYSIDRKSDIDNPNSCVYRPNKKIFSHSVLVIPKRIAVVGFMFLMALLWLWPTTDNRDKADHTSELVTVPPSATGVVGDDKMKMAPSVHPLVKYSSGMTTQDEAGKSMPAREERLLSSRLHRQRVRGLKEVKLQRLEWVLYPEVISQLLNPANWLPELMKASSLVQNRADGEPSRLVLEQIDADSILWDLGLQEGDIIVLIDGEIPQFRPTKALDYIRKAKGALASLDRGEPISLTVLRHQRPVHLVYQALNQE